MIVGKRSLSSRRAWIEIPCGVWQIRISEVALLTESVDRNCLAVSTSKELGVALLTESVDRNCLKLFAV